MAGTRENRQKAEGASPRQAWSWLVRTFRISFTHAAFISGVGACPQREMGVGDQKNMPRVPIDTLKGTPRNQQTPGCEGQKKQVVVGMSLCGSYNPAAQDWLQKARVYVYVYAGAQGLGREGQ